MDKDVVEAYLERIDREGFAIVRDVLTAEQADALVQDIYRLEQELDLTPPAHDLEGSRTIHIHNLLARCAGASELAIHASILPIAEQLLGLDCLLSSMTAVVVEPGEKARPVRASDQLVPMAKPHMPVMCRMIWALDDFKEINGATKVVPGSHKADHSPSGGRHHYAVAADMPKGSVLIMHGSLWHGGGANTTIDERRPAIEIEYCAGWLRQTENQLLAISPEHASGFPPRLRELIGYGLYQGILGHVDTRDPAALLEERASSSRFALS